MQFARFIPLCAAYLAVLPLVGLRAESTLEIGHAMAAPGETDVVVPISLLLDPEEEMVTAVEFAVSYDSSVLGGVSIEAVDEVDFFRFGDQSTFLEAGTAWVAIIWKLAGRPDGVTASRVIANLRFCVLETAASGTYPLDILLEAERVPEGSGRGSVRTVYSVVNRTQAHIPIRASGSISVQGEAVPGSDCEPDVRPPPVETPPPPPLSQSTLEIGQATAAPGETDVVIPISFLLDPEEEMVMGVEFTLSYDPSVLGGVTFEVIDEVDFSQFMEQSTFMEAGTAGVAILWKLFRTSEGLTSSGVIANLRFCVLETAASGTYPLDILLEAERSLGWGGRRVVQTVYTVDSGSHVPLPVAGSITIQGEPVSGSDCEPDDRTPPVIEPPPPLPDVLQATFTLEDRTVVPGATFSTPLIMNGNAEINGFSFSIDFDEGVLQGAGVEVIYERPGGEDYDVMIIETNNSDDTAGNAGVDEGFVIGSVIFDLAGLVPDVLSRDEDHEVLDLSFLVSPGASGGFTDVSFVDGGQGAGQPVKNKATIYHNSVPPETEASMVLFSSLVAIVGDASAFVRGNSNGDDTLDMSDALYTLNFLFLGGSPPSCFDAADTNDDGEVDVSDAVRMLLYLFLGAAPPPPPTEEEPGWDPTSDAMGCGLQFSS